MMNRFNLIKDDKNKNKSGIPIPEWWKSKEEQIQRFLDKEVVEGQIRQLSLSPGGRKVRMVTYGASEPELKGPANFNSALGAVSTDAYYRRDLRKRPVLIILAGVHGQEVEGMMGTVSLIKLMETGKDLIGREQTTLLEKLKMLRLIIIPIANPDGRARVPYDGWIGVEGEELSIWGVGTKKNGDIYWWPHCKAVHPMKGDVGILGGYFDDAGINMMHDEWPSPMSPTTKALLELVGNEGPDMIINLHGHGNDAQILKTCYIPALVKNKLDRFQDELCLKFADKKYPFINWCINDEDGCEGMVPPAFNLDSMLYHVGADMSFTYENPHGIIMNKHEYSYKDFIDMHHILFETAADFCIHK